VPREKWDEADPADNADHDEDMPPISAGTLDRAPRNILPDWTRTPLPPGAPPAVAILSGSPQAVGA
jgi:actin-related protein 10